MDLKQFKKPENKNILKTEQSITPEKMTAQIILKLRPSEKLKIEQQAIDSGIGKLSTYIRSLLKHHDYI